MKSHDATIKNPRYVNTLLTKVELLLSDILSVSSSGTRSLRSVHNVSVQTFRNDNLFYEHISYASKGIEIRHRRRRNGNTLCYYKIEM